MFVPGTSFKYLYFILILLIVFSCRNAEIDIGDNSRRYDDYIKSEFKKYQYVYSCLNDTLKSWKNDSVALSKPYFFDNFNKVDSMMVFNSDSTRCYCNFVEQSVSGLMDGIQGIGGARIHGKWYFFFGSSTVIDRASYQDSIYSPLSFDELSYLAREHLHNAYTIDQNGSIITNDQFFVFMYNRRVWGMSENSTMLQLDSFIVSRTQLERLKKIDVEELNDIKRHMATSKKPVEPAHDVSLWQKWFGEKKLFESQEWKDYLKKKYGNSKK